MIRAYEQAYLSAVMDGIGTMLDYAVNSCGEDLRIFYARFLASGVAEQIERGNPRYLCGLSGIEIAREVAVRTGSPLREAPALIDMGSPQYWTGWALAYLQWNLGKDFKSLQQSGIDAEFLMARYSTLHEADLSKTVQIAKQQLEAFQQQESPLRRMRRNIGLTQAELAQLSGISLRSIRAYEQSQVGLSSASAGSLASLARILGCKPGI